MHHKVALHRRKAPLFRRKVVVRRASYGLQRAPGIRVEREQAPLRWLSLRRWRNTRACRARATWPAGCELTAFYRGTALAEGLSPSVQDRGATCELWSPAAHSRLSRDRREGATALAVSRRWRNTQAFRVRAPCRAGYDRPTRHGRALHQWKASHLPCKTVVRRASCVLQRTAGFPATDTRAPLRSLCLGRWRSTLARRARAVPRWLRSAPAS